MYLVEFLPQVQDRRQLGGPLFLVKLTRFKIGSHQNFELANHLTTDKITINISNSEIIHQVQPKEIIILTVFGYLILISIKGESF